MEKHDWRDDLRACFESIEILKKCKLETAENFKQFCEFIAEPAFEALAEELKGYGVRAKRWILKGKSISLRLHFPRSKADNFQYSISLPKNSVEMKLRLHIRARKTTKSPWEQREEPFMDKVPPDRVMKITKEELLEDVIEHYKNFTYSALTSPE
jgi:hypothetical protein